MFDLFYFERKKKIRAPSYKRQVIGMFHYVNQVVNECSISQTKTGIVLILLFALVCHLYS